MDITVKFLRSALLLVFLTMIAYGLVTNKSTAQQCAGNCNYCVDGRCVPKWNTYGHYQTHWRRWPLQPPEIKRPAKRPSKPDLGYTGDVQTELPEADDEADRVPEFPHLKKRGNGAGPNLAPEQIPLKSLQDPADEPDQDDNPFDDDLPPAVEPPATDEEDGAMRLQPHPLRHAQASASLRGKTREGIRTVAANTTIAVHNPLRSIAGALQNAPSKNPTRLIPPRPKVKRPTTRRAKRQGPILATTASDNPLR